MGIVVALDVHRNQITYKALDQETGELTVAGSRRRRARRCVRGWGIANPISTPKANSVPSASCSDCRAAKLSPIRQRNAAMNHTQPTRTRDRSLISPRPS
jgi:hypothetical protein